MLEFYDSAVKLNLSFNKQINLRGWQAICKAVRDVSFIFVSYNIIDFAKSIISYCRIFLEMTLYRLYDVVI